MKRTSDHIWICFGPSDNHTLHPATICEQNGSSKTPLCRFDPPSDPVAPFPNSLDGQRTIAVLFYHGPQGFLQQPAVIIRVDEHGKPAMRLEPAGIPTIAENRVADRFRVTPDRFSVVMGDEDVCPVIDISPRSIAVTSSEPYKIGQDLAVAFELPGDGTIMKGTCRIRSMKPIDDANRIGLLVSKSDAGTLIEGLRQVIDWVRAGDQRLPEAG